MVVPSGAYAYSVVMPTKDRREVALAAAGRLLAQDALPARLVIVDASAPGLVVPDDLRAAFEGAGVEIEVLHDAPSTSGQRNRGLERVETPIVLFLDDDVALPDDYASSLLRRWQQHGLDSLGAIAGASRA